MLTCSESMVGPPARHLSGLLLAGCLSELIPEMQRLGNGGLRLPHRQTKVTSPPSCKANFKRDGESWTNSLIYDMQQSDIWRLRALALIEHEFGIQSNDPRRWERLAMKLAEHYVSGFSIKKARDNKHGAPLEWSHQQLAQLFADVEFLKKSTGDSVRHICAELPKRKVYKGRWGRYKEAALRKAYSRAQAFLRENRCDMQPFRVLWQNEPKCLSGRALRRPSASG